MVPGSMETISLTILLLRRLQQCTALHTFLCVHTYYKANQAADYLANFACINQAVSLWTERFPAGPNQLPPVDEAQISFLGPGFIEIRPGPIRALPTTPYPAAAARHRCPYADNPKLGPASQAESSLLRPFLGSKEGVGFRNQSRMALVVICGQPCSGKSTAATCLAEALQAVEPKPTVRIIDESSLHLGRNQSYADMTVEKNLRGVLRSEVDRSLSRDNVIIVDSLNNIKGYRYELWCLARASRLRYCVIFCDVEENHCREWNNKRSEMGESSYDTKIFDDLVRRFEKPDRRNRWDSPLFELFPSRDGIKQSSPVISEAVSYLTKKVDSKTRDVRVLQPTIATQIVRATEANSLYEIDRATQEVINAIVEAQSCGLAGTVNKISLSQHLPTVSIQRTVGLPELRSLRRTFIKLAGQASLSGPPPPSDAESAKRMFIDYLNREIGAA